jgi:hypothetical protein
MPAFGRYLRSWGLTTLCLLACVALINLIVDPYGIFNVVNVKGFNAVKSQAGQRALLFKRAALERMRPNALILGNSRAEIGFNPASPAWPAAARPVINLALPGTGTRSALDEFRNALDEGNPRVALIALDFLDFRTDQAPPTDSELSRPDRIMWVRDRIAAILTMSALLDSVATVSAQYRAFPSSLTETGFNPMRDYAGIARNEGYSSMFRQRDAENAKAYVRGSRTIYQADGRTSNEFRAVEQIIALASEKGVAVRFAIYPYHGHILVLLHQAGLWPAFEAWKRELVQRVDMAPPGADIELWDFSGFSPYADERIPPPGDTASDMRWYWEAGHFKEALGDVMLERMFDRSPTSSGWGSRLTANDLATNLERLRRERDEYESTHGAETAELAALVAAASEGGSKP